MEDLRQFIKTDDWKIIKSKIEEIRQESINELINIDFTQENASMIANGIKRYIEGLDEIFNVIDYYTNLSYEE